MRGRLCFAITECRRIMVLAIAIFVAPLLVTSQLAAVEVPVGFSVEIVTSGPPLDTPLGLRANPDGTFFVTDLGAVPEVLLMTASGQLSLVFSGDPLVSPIDAQRPPAGSPFGSALFIADGNAFGTLGAVFRQEPNGQLSVVYQGFTQPIVQADPSFMAFGTGGGFGFDLFVSDPSSALAPSGGATGGIVRVTPQGVVSSFLFGPPLVDPAGLAFGPGGAFGTDLYVGEANLPGTGRIWTIDSQGTITSFATSAAFVNPGVVAFAPPGPFGGDLYVGDGAAQVVFRVDALGNVTPFATAIAGPAGIAFGADGNLYVVEQSTASVVRISPAVCVPPPSGLVSWWPGDGNANDIVGGNDGVLVNGATFAAGNVGQAFSFDGVDDSVEIPDPGPNSNLDLSSFTLDAWINVPATIPTFQTVVAKTTEVSPGQFQRNYGLHVNASGLATHTPGTIVVSFSDGANNFFAAQGTTVVTDAQWHHVAGTYDGVQLRVFIDGIEETTTVPTFPIGGGLPDVFDGPVSIGLDVPNAPRFPMDGLIDEVDIFDRALLASEIQAIFNAGSAGKCKDPVIGPGPGSPRICGTTQMVDVGQTIMFDIVASHPDLDEMVTLDVVSLPVGATMTPSLPASGNPVSSTFAWTPGAKQDGIHLVTFTATDSSGGAVDCPVTFEVMGVGVPTFPCFGVAELEIRTGDDDSDSSDDDSSDDSSSSDDSDRLELEGALDAGLDFNPILEDITFQFVDEADGDTHTFFIPAGSFELHRDGEFRFESRSIEAEFDLDDCEFEFEVDGGPSFDNMDGPDITVRLIASASGVGEQTVTTEVNDDKLEFEADPEPQCCPDDDSSDDDSSDDDSSDDDSSDDGSSDAGGQRDAVADINSDGIVDVLDLVDLLDCLGQPARRACHTADLNGDRMVDVLDVIDLLSAFGTASPRAGARGEAQRGPGAAGPTLLANWTSSPHGGPDSNTGRLNSLSDVTTVTKPTFSGKAATGSVGGFVRNADSGDPDEPIPFDIDGNPRFVDDPDQLGTPGPKADVNHDGVVDMVDLIELLLCFGEPADPPCALMDVNGDGVVNGSDLQEVVTHFGP